LIDIKLPKVRTSLLEGISTQHCTTSCPILPPKSSILVQEGRKILTYINNTTSSLNVCKSPKFSYLTGNWGRGTRWWRQILDWTWKCGCFAHTQWKIQYNPIYGWIAENSTLYYRNSSFIVDVAMGQIPRSTEHISSYYYNLYVFKAVVNCHCRSLADMWASRSGTGPVSTVPVTYFHIWHWLSGSCLQQLLYSRQCIGVNSCQSLWTWENWQWLSVRASWRCNSSRVPYCMLHCIMYCFQLCAQVDCAWKSCQLGLLLSAVTTVVGFD